MSAVAGERVVVLGAGTSGVASTQVLVAEGAAEVRVSERERVPDPAAFATLGVHVFAGGHRPEHLDGATLVVTSPGVADDADVLTWARDRRLPIWSELELGARITSVPYVAVTGTNGKTTTTELTAAAYRAAGMDAVACGNIGYPFSLAAREGHDLLVVEASSFQLRFVESFRPRISALLNLSADHLDWHGSFEAYASAKAAVFRRQGEGDLHVGNADDPAAAAVSRTAPCPVRWFTLGPPAPGDVGSGDGGLEALLEDGEHVALGAPASASAGFRADVAAAAAITLADGVDRDAIRRTVRDARPLPHRGSVVATVGGVRFVDDSKATNPHAALAAIAGVRDAVLIAGGRSKGVDLGVLQTGAGHLRGVVAIGEAAPELIEIFEGLVKDVRRADTIDDAVRLAFDLAPPDGVVLLAPACASQDMFSDYRERGDRFAAAAVSLSKEGSVG